MGALRIVAGGDVAIGGILTGLSATDLALRVKDVVSMFARGDLSIVSLDCAIGEAGKPPHPEEYVIDGPAQNLVLLEHLGVHLVSLANNHSTDRGFEALVAGRSELSRRGILAVGTRLSPRQATGPMRDAHQVDLTPWKYATPTASLLVAMVIGIYLLFSPWGLAG